MPDRPAKPCACGGLISASAYRSGTRRCRNCFHRDEAAARDARRADIAALWHEGWLIREIAEELQSTPGAIGVEITRMRAAGWDVPYRWSVP